MSFVQAPGNSVWRTQISLLPSDPWNPIDFSKRAGFLTAQKSYGPRFSIRVIWCSFGLELRLTLGDTPNLGARAYYHNAQQGRQYDATCRSDPPRTVLQFSLSHEVQWDSARLEQLAQVRKLASAEGLWRSMQGADRTGNQKGIPNS
jgi:hypothetical protein